MELEKEKFLHSLNPQLERWHLRVNAITQVLLEVHDQAHREASAAAGEVSTLAEVDITCAHHGGSNI